MALMKMPCAVGTGSGTSDNGTFTYPSSSSTITIPSKIKANGIDITIIKDSTNLGVCGCRFSSDGSAGYWWFGDSYSGGRFLLSPSSLSFVRNSDNTISFISTGSAYLGGYTAYWVAYE